MIREPLILPKRAGTTRWVLTLEPSGLGAVRSLPSLYRERRCSWVELIELVRIAPPAAVVLLDPRENPPNPALHPQLPELLNAAAMVPVVAMVPLEPPYGESIRWLVGHGVSEIADARFEAMAGTLGIRLAAAHAQPLKRRIEPAVSRFASARALTLVRAAAEVVVDRGRSVGLAKLFGTDERTVTSWCAREGLPPVRRLLAWLRVLLAVALLEDRVRTVANVAMCCGYTDHSLRRALREFLGGSAQPRDRSLNDALDRFNSGLGELREKVRQRRV